MRETVKFIAKELEQLNAQRAKYELEIANLDETISQKSAQLRNKRQEEFEVRYKDKINKYYRYQCSGNCYKTIEYFHVKEIKSNSQSLIVELVSVSYADNKFDNFCYYADAEFYEDETGTYINGRAFDQCYEITGTRFKEFLFNINVFIEDYETI